MGGQPTGLILARLWLYVPVNVAAGALPAGVYASHQNAVDAAPYNKLAVLSAISTLEMAVFEDMGVLNTEVDDVTAVGADLASPADMFNLVSDFHMKAGSLSMTTSKMGDLVTEAFRRWGVRRGEVLRCEP